MTAGCGPLRDVWGVKLWFIDYFSGLPYLFGSAVSGETARRRHGGMKFSRARLAPRGGPRVQDRRDCAWDAHGGCHQRRSGIVWIATRCEQGGCG